MITIDDERDLERGNSCWIWSDLYDEEDNKVTDQDHLTSKYRGTTHKVFNVNFKLTENFLQYFIIWEELTII